MGGGALQTQTHSEPAVLVQPEAALERQAVACNRIRGALSGAARASASASLCAMLQHEGSAALCLSGFRLQLCWRVEAVSEG
eukprot:1308371-Rhodomonas_salina.1